MKKTTSLKADRITLVCFLDVLSLYRYGVHWNFCEGSLLNGVFSWECKIWRENFNDFTLETSEQGTSGIEGSFSIVSKISLSSRRTAISAMILTDVSVALFFCKMKRLRLLSRASFRCFSERYFVFIREIFLSCIIFDRVCLSITDKWFLTIVLGDTEVEKSGELASTRIINHHQPQWTWILIYW